MRTFILAVTGLMFAAVAACSSYGTSVVEVRRNKTPVASVSISVPASLAAGQSARATATPKDANGVVLTDRPVTWFTSSATIASVNDSGVVSAVAPGNALVSAVSEGVAGQAALAVTPPQPTPVATVIVTLSPSAVVAGQTAYATATLEDSSGNPIANRVVTWESSNTAVATVDPAGTVKAVASGNAMIKATSEGKSNASALSVSAAAPIPVASVSVTPPSASLQVGGTVQLSAATRDANNNVLTGRVIGWSSGNAAIATVSSSGLVTAKTAGSVSITAASEGQTGSATITVSAPAPVPVATVSVSPSAPSLQVGGTVQ
ncbi:MAG: Ig-like domain-containing protein, partial [Burkholderiales bacterium]